MTDQDKDRRLIPVIALATIFVVIFLVCPLLFAAEHGGEAHGGVLGYRPDQWFNLLWRVINFVLLAGILFWALKKPVGKMLSDRQVGIKQKFDELEASKAEVEKLYAEHEKKLATIEQEAKRVMQEYVEEGKAEKERIIQEAMKAAESIKKQAEFAIQQEINRAKLALSAEMAEQSVSLASELIRKSLNESDHQRLIDDYIAKVVHKN